MIMIHRLVEHVIWILIPIRTTPRLIIVIVLAATHWLLISVIVPRRLIISRSIIIIIIIIIGHTVVAVVAIGITEMRSVTIHGRIISSNCPLSWLVILITIIDEWTCGVGHHAPTVRIITEVSDRIASLSRITRRWHGHLYRE